MAGAIFPDIDPSVTSGTDLANLLNDFKDLVASGAETSGGSRPANLQAGGLWVDQQNDPVWDLKQYTGTTDYTLLTLDKGTGSVTFGTFGAALKLTKDSDDSLPPILTLFKKRTSGDEATDDSDIVGQIDFSGNSDTPAEQITAQIEVVAEDNYTDLVHGSRMVFYTTPEGAATLTERLRIDKTGKFGLNTAADALALFHIKGDATKSDIRNEHSADTATGPASILKKSRIAASGQVLLSDTVGQIDFVSTDEVGADQTVARIEVVATENTTAAEHGAEMIFSVVSEDDNTLTEVFRIKDGKILGDDDKQKLTLEDDTLTRNLADIDGTVYGSVSIDVKARGRDNAVDERFQISKIEAVYDEINTEWYVSREDNVLSDGDPLLDFNVTSGAVAGATLDINYVTQIASGVFQDGFIYLDIRRVKV